MMTSSLCTDSTTALGSHRENQQNGRLIGDVSKKISRLLRQLIYSLFHFSVTRALLTKAAQFVLSDLTDDTLDMNMQADKQITE